MRSYNVGTPVRISNTKTGETLDGVVSSNSNVWEENGQLRGWYVVRDADGQEWHALHMVTEILRCEACGAELRERADCHYKDHQENVCKSCDTEYAHVWPRGTLLPEE